MEANPTAAVRLEQGAIFAIIVFGLTSLVLGFCALYLRPSQLWRMRRSSPIETEKKRISSKPSLSISINDVSAYVEKHYIMQLIFKKGTYEVIGANLVPLISLGIKFELYLFVQVPNQEAIATVLDAMEKTGCFGEHLLKHRVLFSTTSGGRASMVRQLQPLLHMESDATVVNTVLGKVANVMHFAFDSDESGDAEAANKSECGDIVKIKSTAEIMTLLQPIATS
ncbi:hypothetical protein, conserved [Babesia ovata]|uniref:Uncharacterized protein n=1 Tax=Babesia ovata TaxID=189622 RepID=A0A2H6K871_9APIC|nr:uncharacterized protein BOVATA_006950 [Babesia ovata]GBE59202.1 hypothetical protein, conserved [Babesia ovata]